MVTVRLSSAPVLVSAIRPAWPGDGGSGALVGVIRRGLTAVGWRPLSGPVRRRRSRRGDCSRVSRWPMGCRGAPSRAGT